jgi:ankyrin repeat protein
LLAIAAGDTTAALALLDRDPGLAKEAANAGATRAEAAPHFLPAIGHYVYAGDTALHIAGAAHAPDLARRLLALGADPAARNRRGATPLHYAADARPGVPAWNAAAQAETIACLVAAGAGPDLPDLSGVTPLHRAVRTRGALAVAALLAAGADPDRRNGNGSTARDLATRTTGRSGSGLPGAKAQQAEILALFDEL